jgi:hypothetical protein
MYEHKSHPLIPKQVYYQRVFKHVFYAVCLIFVSLGVGVLCYHILEGLGWVDSILNASMILGGMGPVNEVHTTLGKLFASAYALFSGIFFLVIAGVIFAPIFHRFLHKFHLESKK